MVAAYNCSHGASWWLENGNDWWAGGQERCSGKRCVWWYMDGENMAMGAGAVVDMYLYEARQAWRFLSLIEIA